MARNHNPRHRLSPRYAAGLAISTFIALGTLATSASADDHRYDHRDDRGRRGWSGGYYAPPPVVYAAPYYAPPPVVYGPAVGIYAPGISIGIR